MTTPPLPPRYPLYTEPNYLDRCRAAARLARPTTALNRTPSFSSLSNLARPEGPATHFTGCYLTSPPGTRTTASLYRTHLALAPASPPQAGPHQKSSTSTLDVATPLRRPPGHRKEIFFVEKDGARFPQALPRSGGPEETGGKKGKPGESMPSEGSRFCRSPPLPRAPEKSLPVGKNFLPPRPPHHHCTPR